MHRCSRLTVVHCGASGQSPQEQRCAESQQAGMLLFIGAMPFGVLSSPGKSIWKGDPVLGKRLSCAATSNDEAQMTPPRKDIPVPCLNTTAELQNMMLNELQRSEKL